MNSNKGKMRLEIRKHLLITNYVQNVHHHVL